MGQEKRNLVQNKSIIKFSNSQNHGSQICRDSETGLWFWSTRFRVEQAINKANRQLYHEGYLDFFNFLSKFGISSSTASHQLGWNLKRMTDLIDVRVEYLYDLQIGTYMQLSYDPAPEMYYLD